ncbi:MAG: class I SAM-dependent methyltransferase [Cyanobacteria bacterium P01_E01_bin.42]
MPVSRFSTSDRLLDIIRDRITDSPHQRINFAEYMDLVLYHSHYGYYTIEKPKIGDRGDFFTSSSLSSDFAELLAEQFVQVWQILGSPKLFSLVEMGAGEGIFAFDVLSYLSLHNPDCFAALQYKIIEQSPSFRERQQGKLQKFIEGDRKVCWQTWEEIDDRSQIGCFFANELVDAFPVHRVIRKDGKLQETYVTWKDGKLVEAIAEISRPKLQEYFDLIEIDLLTETYPEDYRTEVNLEALGWIERVSQKLKQGYLFTIDYGYKAERYYNMQRYQGTLKCYYQHHHHDNPYVNLGYQDITAHVNFTALERQGNLCNLQVTGFTQQGLFLMALGLGDRLAELSTRKLKITEVIKRREVLHQLIDPAGLGKFGVLVQSKGLDSTQENEPLKGLITPSRFS